MKSKLKKTIMKVATLGMVVAPISATISCGKTDSILILSGKSQIQKLGMQFAKTFDGMAEGKVKGAPSLTKFTTANGDTFKTTLATSVGSSQFPSAMTIANASDVKTYLERDVLLKFKDPKYDKTTRKATVADAEEYNKKIAGNKINELIKAIQLSNNPKFMVSGNMIIGIPTYTESIGVIYNKSVFRENGIKNVKYSAKTATANDSIFLTNNSSIKVDETHDTLYADDLTSDNFKKLKNWFKTKNVEAVGTSVSGKESWAFTSKVGMAATIGWAAKMANLKLGNVHMPGETISNNELTPDTAQTKLFGPNTTIDKGGKITGENSKGFEVYKDALELYIKDSKSYTTKQGMSDGFVAGQFAMMPGGSWMEGYLSKGGFKDFGMLPLSMLTDSENKPFIANGISGYWQFANQSKANKRKGEKAIAAQTKAVNFVWAQYLSQQGRNILKNDMGLLNPYDSSASASPNAEHHPLLATSQKIKTVSAWGVSSNKPGVGAKGFERNNTEYTALLDKYQKNPNETTMIALLKKVKEIWNP